MVAVGEVGYASPTAGLPQLGSIAPEPFTIDGKPLAYMFTNDFPSGGGTPFSGNAFIVALDPSAGGLPADKDLLLTFDGREIRLTGFQGVPNFSDFYTDVAADVQYLKSKVDESLPFTLISIDNNAVSSVSNSSSGYQYNDSMMAFYKAQGARGDQFNDVETDFWCRLAQPQNVPLPYILSDSSGNVLTDNNGTNLRT